MKEWICKTKILIVGLGLMGGSYAKALKRMGYTVSAVDPNEASLAYALEHKLIDKGYTEPTEDAVAESDVIILAIYPRLIPDWIKNAAPFMQPGTLITDVTGVKSCVVYAVQALLPDGVEFIAAHPMAGREVSGVENSDDNIFRKANYIVTPTEKNSEEAIEWCRHLGRLLGCSNIAILTPEEHDKAIAFVSQLTHCIAVSLMTCNDNTHLSDYTGDSFRDLTRIARINDKMWAELFISNKQALLDQMDSFLSEMNTLRELLYTENEEGLREKMRLSTSRRKVFDKQL